MFGNSLFSQTLPPPPAAPPTHTHQARVTETSKTPFPPSGQVRGAPAARWLHVVGAERAGDRQAARSSRGPAASAPRCPDGPAERIPRRPRPTPAAAAGMRETKRPLRGAARAGPRSPPGSPNKMEPARSLPPREPRSRPTRHGWARPGSRPRAQKRPPSRAQPGPEAQRPRPEAADGEWPPTAAALAAGTAPGGDGHFIRAKVESV